MAGRNTKQTSADVAALAARLLNNSSASSVQKSLAAAALSQSKTGEADWCSHGGPCIKGTKKREVLGRNKDVGRICPGSIKPSTLGPL